MKKLLIASILAATSTLSYAEKYPIATGGEGGGYYRAGMVFKGKVESNSKGKRIKVEVVPTTGSINNIEMMNSGEVKAALVQRDALSIKPPSSVFKSRTLYQEKVFWIYNPAYGYTDFKKVEGEDVKIALVTGSGANITLENFVKEDDGYAGILSSAVPADDLYDALSLVAEGSHNNKKLVGTLYVGRILPWQEVEDFKGSISVGEVTDWDFDDAKDYNGELLYKECYITPGLTGGLTMYQEELETVCVDSMLIYTQPDNRKNKRVIQRAVNQTAKELK